MQSQSDVLDEITQQNARAQSHCIACGGDKDGASELTTAALLCWPCFKRPHGLKHAGLTFSAWLARELQAGRITKLHQEDR